MEKQGRKKVANKYDEIWNLRKDTLKPKKMKRLRLEEIIPKDDSNNAHIKITKPKDIWKNFVKNSSFHGVKYWLDDNLTMVERIFWKIIVFLGFASATYIICSLYGNYQDRKTNLIIDKLQASFREVPFPSVTICPDFKPSNESIYKTLNELFPNTTHETKKNLKKFILKLLELDLITYHKIDLDMGDINFQEIGDLRPDVALLKLMPDCKDILFDCKWNFESVNCCEIFEIQKSYSGYCYSFNSQTSMNISHSEPKKAYSTGSRSGLLFTMKSPIFANGLASLIIDDPFAYPNRGLSITIGHKYEMALTFSAVQSASEVLALENIINPPCKYQNGMYRMKNCHSECLRRHFLDQCGCTPARYFHADSKACSIKAIECLKTTITNLSNYFNQDSSIQNCNCSKACEKYKYEMFMSDRPYEKDAISMNVFFYKSHGIRYKRVIVVTDLDMIVEFGGIFGLFVGGSIVDLMDIVITFIKSIVSWIHQCYKLFRK